MYGYQTKKTKQETTKSYHIHFSSIKDFFSEKKKSDLVYHPLFFKVVEAVFCGNYLNEKLILREFLKKIRADFKQQNEEEKKNLYIRRTKESFVLYQYFLHLYLFKNKQAMTNELQQLNFSTPEDFIKQHPEFFDSEYKVGVFLLGYLSAYLMGKQYKKLKNTPFIKQLNSLNIDEKTVKMILPKLINKLREYEAALPEVEQRIAKALVTQHRLSKVDISYAFTLGLILQREFAKAYHQESTE